MNSESLQKAFPEVYRNFFSKSEIVVSTARNFWWIGEYAELFGGLTIIQKIPLRIYIGLKKIPENKIEVASYNIFLPHRRRFEEKPFNRISELRLNEFLVSYLRELGGEENPGGFKIEILAEISLERGLGSFGVMAAALMTAIFIYYKKINQSMIARWKKIKTMDLINNPAFGFSALHRAAWKAEAALDISSSSGCRSFGALISSDYPLIYFTEKRSGNVKSHPRSRMPADLEGNYNLVDKIQYWGSRMDEFFDFKTKPFWSIDFGLIFSGDLRITGNIIQSSFNINKQLDEVSGFIKREFNNFLSLDDSSQTKDKILPYFYNNVIKEGGQGLLENYMEALSVTSLDSLKCFYDIFQSGSSPELIKEFLRIINYYQNVFDLFNVTSPTINYICSYIGQEVFRNKKITDFGIKSTGAGGGGDILFSAPYGELQAEIEKYVEILAKKTKKDIWLDYASWLDGSETDGVRIEQDLADRIYSKFVSEKSIMIKTWDGKAKDSSNLYTSEEFWARKSDFDLLIDEIEQKIYVRGELLTSKEIHSATETIEVLKILLNNFNKEVEASSLPDSSYVDRNEMQSKVVSPLVKAIRKRTGKKLPLSISGRLRKDFSLKLEPSEVKIYLIQKS